MTKSFRFDAALIQSQGRVSFQGEVSPEKIQAALGGEPFLSGFLLADLDLAWRSGEIDFQGKVSGEWQLECSRCLALSPSGYKARLDGTLKPENGIIDLTEEVRQALLLAVPMQNRCDPHCKGLCPVCKASRNGKGCGCAVP